jgi:hypothetical protein
MIGTLVYGNIQGIGKPQKMTPIYFKVEVKEEEGVYKFYDLLGRLIFKAKSLCGKECVGVDLKGCRAFFGFYWEFLDENKAERISENELKMSLADWLKNKTMRKNFE